MVPPLFQVLFPPWLFSFFLLGLQCCVFVTNPTGPWSSVYFYLFVFPLFLKIGSSYCSVFRVINSFLCPLHSVVKLQSVHIGNCIYQFLNFYLHLLNIFYLVEIFNFFLCFEGVHNCSLKHFYNGWFNNLSDNSNTSVSTYWFFFPR